MKFGKISYIVLICMVLIAHTMILNIWLSNETVKPTKVSFKKYQDTKDSLKHEGRLINYKDVPAQKEESISVSR
ncbi:hypothetical protein [Pedobacter puniceum]|jgi:hypothetical protein|uniref:Uncharacterized protein n=1 Tax=Pedobacter puniceum TaxID=2666136 RepID=A0A7K0FQ66_9SPHI|nr:hypothetical protein [Pedobacter puniceum]MRX48109.1 hypothetical protein [Pedobacter puniceum]